MDNIAINTEGQFLVAMPSLDCPVFSRTLVLMLEHSDEGAIGLIINKPLDIETGEILRQLNPAYWDPTHSRHLFYGGPVANEQGFVLHPPGNFTWKNQILLRPGLAVTTSSDILEWMSEGNDIGEYMIVLGYAGWGPDQLEQELASNAWLTVATDPVELLTIKPEQRLAVAISKLGISYEQLSGQSGHA